MNKIARNAIGIFLATAVSVAAFAALESATYIDDLVSTNPTSGDAASQGDDHIRLIKSTVKATFPNISAPVTPTHTELNFIDGVTSAVCESNRTNCPTPSTTATGIIELATSTEVRTGTDTSRAIVPDALHDLIFALGIEGTDGSSEIVSASGGASGWTLSDIGNGVTLTHGLSLSDVDNLICTVTASPGLSGLIATVTSKNANDFTIAVNNDAGAGNNAHDLDVICFRVGA